MPKKQKTNTTIVLIDQDGNCLYDPQDTSSVPNDIILWLVITLLLAFIVIVIVCYTYVAVNSTRNLGPTLISPYNFYPGQFMQNEFAIFQLTSEGILTLSNEQDGIIWQSTNINNFSSYFVYASFGNDGSLTVLNYYDQILFSLTPNSEEMGPYILNLTSVGKVIIKSSDGTTIICIPESFCDNV